MKGGTDLNSALLDIKFRADNEIGNKTILICTDGDVNANEIVTDFIAVNTSRKAFN